MTDQAATPAAASRMCDGPNSPGTASANAAAIGSSATAASAVASRGEPARLNSAPSTVATATAADGVQPDRRVGDHPVHNGQRGGHEDQADGGQRGGPLDVPYTPGAFAGNGEDHRGVGDVLDDARRRRAHRDRLQCQQITIDDTYRVQGGLETERCATDGRQAQKLCRISTGFVGRGDDALHRRQDFPQRKLGRQRHSVSRPPPSASPVASGEHGDAHDRHHRVVGCDQRRIWHSSSLCLGCSSKSLVTA